jgi:hypothetical protein
MSPMVGAVNANTQIIQTISKIMVACTKIQMHVSSSLVSQTSFAPICLGLRQTARMEERVGAILQTSNSLTASALTLVPTTLLESVSIKTTDMIAWILSKVRIPLMESSQKDPHVFGVLMDLALLARAHNVFLKFGLTNVLLQRLYPLTWRPVMTCYALQ